jgi:hypothetical protein
MLIIEILVITTIKDLDAELAVRIQRASRRRLSLLHGRFLDFLGDFLFVLGLGFAVLVVVFNFVGGNGLLAVIGDVPTLPFELNRRRRYDQLHLGIALRALVDVRIGKLLDPLEAMFALLTLVFVKRQKTPYLTDGHESNRDLILRLTL